MMALHWEGSRVPVEDLEAAYFEVMMEEPGTTLEAFLERVLSGALGPHDNDTLVAFLRRVERMIVGSIQTRAAASAAAAAEADEKAEEQRELIARLIARVLSQGG